MKNRVHPLIPSLLFLLLTGVATPGRAIVTFGDDVELEGFLNFQNIVRTPKFESTELVMQRNTAQVEGKYYFLRDSTAFGRFNTGRLEEATFTFVGRSVYDSIYDIRQSYHDAFENGDDHPGEIEIKAREAFVDLLLPPFSLRLGKQQVVWGETDNFRALDVINPLDLSWHWSWESWEDIRIPLWMARGVYDIGKFGPFDESFFEAVWIPWDVQSNIVSTDPRRPWAFTGTGLNETANSAIVNGQILNLDLKVNDSSPGRRFENGQGGFRFKAIWGEIEFSLNYFYGFATDTGVKFRNDLLRIDNGTLHAEVDTVNPRTHLVGITANYSEEKYTQAVFRLESVFTTGVPVSVAAGAPLNVDPEQDQFEDVRRSVVMIAVDRPTWIKALNEDRTFFLSSQFFWRRYLDYSDSFRGFSAVRPAILNGQIFPGRFISEQPNQLNRDEFVITFAASTSYGDAGLLQPRFVFAIDPISTGAYNQIGIDYLLSTHVVLKFQQNLFWRASGHDVGPWALGDLWGHSSGQSRHETVFSLVYQF
ncbi:MAG: hypothetical protein EXR86_07395 [Gammaproteobacteria bacterium]|nr:hypothetical protein [Gammaproteobacteria bacterium]